jgi:hypothetical protein
MCREEEKNVADRPSFMKRKREQDRLEKRKAKAERKAARRAEAAREALRTEGTLEGEAPVPDTPTEPKPAG